MIETALAEVQRKLRCVQRALFVMTVLAALAIAGLCYCAVLFPDFPQTFAHSLMQFAVKCCCALGLAAIVCLVAFSVLDLRYHKELERKRELRRQCLVDVSVPR